MASGGKSGTFVGLIFFHMRSAEGAHARGDSYLACSHLTSAARLVKAKLPALPYLERNPYYSPGMQQKFAMYYIGNLPFVAGAVRDFVDQHSNSDLDVDGGDDNQ